MSLPSHVEETVAAIAQMHERHDQKASPIQRALESATAIAGSARALAVVLVASAIWAAVNVWIATTGHRPFDPPPFQWLELLLTLLALLLAILILATQRRADSLADSRERMTLEAVLATDQKTSKIIQLLEELRRDTPTVPNRLDPEAHDMSKKVSPDAVLVALEDDKPDRPNSPKKAR